MKTTDASLFNCTPIDPAPAVTTPATSKRGKSSKSEPLPPDAICPTCTRELAVFYRGRAWCIHCEQAELFPAKAGAK